MGEKMMIQKLLLLTFIALSLSCTPSENTKPDTDPEEIEVPDRLKLGYSLGAQGFTNEKLQHAKAVGIDYVEVSGTSAFFNNNREITKTDAELKSIFANVLTVTETAGIKVNSIHMVADAYMDLSTIIEADRQKVVAGHIQLLDYIKVLKPTYILFHPSYYLDPPNQREQRKSQLLKSLNELNEAVQAIGSILVVENMLGPALMAGERERPLMRNIEECKEIMDRLPQNIGLAVDMCHIDNPELLIRALGSRLKTVHVSDGTGRAENHYFPCSGQGDNDWNAILKALDDVGYTGVFLYECAYDDERDLVNCYNTLYENYVKSLKK